MADPKGYLVVPVGFRADGSIHALELNTSDALKVEVTNTNLVETPHNLLDGAINQDTEAGTVLEGDIIVGVDTGAGVIKWKRLSRGSTGQIPVIQSDGSIAYETITGDKTAQIVLYETGAVATGTTTVPADDSIPQNTEGDEYMSVAITPTNASSTLVIDAVGHFSSNALELLVFSLFKDSVASSLKSAANQPAGVSNLAEITLHHEAVAGSTSSITFKIRCGGNNVGTTTFNGIAGSRYYGGILNSFIRIEEILP
jgi:hypothetical protein